MQVLNGQLTGHQGGLPPMSVLNLGTQAELGLTEASFEAPVTALGHLTVDQQTRTTW